MYTLVLTVHSWIRWALVLCAAVACIRSGTARRRARLYGRGDRRLGQAFATLLNLQLLLGLALYVFLSPITRAALADLGAAMGSSTLRFFVIEHQVAALIAISIGHFGLVKAKRAQAHEAKHKYVFWGAAGCLLMILVAIPWPFLPYARALFRL